MGKSVPQRKSFRSKIYSHIQNVDSHIDNVKNSLQHLVFSNEKEIEQALLKKRITVVIIITILLMILGSFLSPKGKAEMATFYPTSCLGGWNNPRNAEGEPQVKSNNDESSFTKENSAILPQTVNADIYCGGFVGEIKENTKPTKILVSLSWSKGEDIILEQTITGESFASSSQEILDIASTTDVSFTLGSTTDDSVTSSSTIISTEETSSASIINNVIDKVEDAFGKIFGNDEIVSTTTENFITPPVVEPEIDATNSTPPPTLEDAPKEETPPVSILDIMTQKITSHFFGKVFAEETPQITETVSLPLVTTQEESPQSSVDTSVSVSETKGEEVPTEDILVQVSSTTETTGVVITVASTSTDIELEQSSTTESASIVTFFGSSTGMVSDGNAEDQSPNNFLEILYSFDGSTWVSLGKVNESSMRYRTFEIPVTATTSWGDMNQLQIKVQKLERVDTVPAVYLDGITVEVLYETPVLHEHPDFSRDTILKDKSDDGVRVVNIINSDTNNNEIWYTTIGSQGSYGVAPGSWVQVTLDDTNSSHKLIDIYGQNIFWADDTRKLLWVSNLQKGTNDGIDLVNKGTTTIFFTKTNGEEWVFEYDYLTKTGLARIRE